MTNSTLGGLLKDYRLQKGIAQIDIAFALGWKETSRLSRIEQGRTERPPRELLDRITSALGLEEEEINTLLLTGSYLPTQEEILKVKKDTESILKSWPYPAVILDFSWRVIHQNDYLSKLFNMSPSLVSEINKSQVRVLDVVFANIQKNLSSSTKNESLLSSLREVITQFKYEQRHRTKEKWYIDHVKRLMDDNLFRQLWIEAKRDTVNIVLGKHTKKQFVHPKDKNKLLNFYLFIVPVLKDPRFEVELHVPVDIETYRYYHETS